MRVNMDNYLVNQIVANVQNVVYNSKGSLPSWPTEAPAGVGDELFSMVLPADHEKTIVDLAPDWVFPKGSGLYVSVARNKEAAAKRYSPEPTVYAPYSKDHISITGHTTLRNIPGIEMANWYNNSLHITPATDGSTIQLPAVRDFVESISAINKIHDDLADEMEKASNDMRNFLSQYRTLNKAVAKFGPALWEFVPPAYKEKYNRPVDKKEPKAKKERPTIDLDYLVARATEARLQMH